MLARTHMTKRSDNDSFYFEGFESPNTTPVPDVVFDLLLARLGEAELKALLYIIRRTFGFKKDRDPISFNQFLRGITTREGKTLDGGCGVKDRTTLSKALKSLEAKGIVLSDKGVDERGENSTTVYSLRFRGMTEAGETGLAASSERVVGIPYHPSRNRLPPVVGNPYPQQTALQETEIQLSNIRKTSKNAGRSEENKASLREEIARGQMQGFRITAPRPVEAIGAVMKRSAVAQAVERRRGQDPDRRDEATANSNASRLSEASKGGESAPSAPGRGRLRRVPHQDEAYQVIQGYIADFARELNDKAPLKSSTTRAYNLYRRSGLEVTAFIAQLYAARSIVKEKNANIRSQGEKDAWGVPIKHKAAFYFAVLEDLLFGDDKVVGPSEDLTIASPRRSSSNRRVD